MMKRIGILIAALGALHAQQPVAPTNEPVGPVRGEEKGDYSITNSVEFGYRWRLVGGDLGEYRSDVNYGNGVRLLSGSFSVNSKDGHGHYFDQIQLNVLGLGNDPYQSASLRVQKNGLYRYDMLWRLNDYFNPGLTVAGGLHLFDTVQRIQDHELLLFPQSHYRLRMGYGRNTMDGPALSTAQEFDANGVGLPVFRNINQVWNEYRLGGDVEYAGFKFTVLHRWDYFRDGKPFTSLGTVSGPSIGVPSDPTVLTNFFRNSPQHGSAPAWLGNLLAARKKWAVNARISYLKGINGFFTNEAATGISRFGDAANRQITVQGNAQRPFVAGDLNLTFIPIGRLTIVNTTSANSQRIDGPSAITEVLNGVDLGTSLYFRYLGIFRVTNATDANVRVNKWLGFYTGYGYTYREVKTIEGFGVAPTPPSDSRSEFRNFNSLHTGTLGVRVRPLKGLTASVEGNIGRADNPFTPVSDGNYHAINGRVDYRIRKLQLGTSYKQFYNINSPGTLNGINSHSRNYTATASWAPRDWFSLDANYMKLHLDTMSGIAYFAGTGNRNTLQSAISFYRSNIHAGILGMRIAVQRRADLYFAYSIIDDTGGDHVPIDPTILASDLLESVQTFPVTYQSPSARLSIRITPKLRWNVGYQFYNYKEQVHIFSFNQDFRANTGYTSVLFSW
jgi:hypothetical protein